MTALLWVAAAMMLLAVALGLWRVAKGPTTLERMLGFDLVTVTLAGLVLVFSALTGEHDYVELVLVLSGLGFLTTVAYFYYLAHLEPDADEPSAPPSTHEAAPERAPQSEPARAARLSP